MHRFLECPEKLIKDVAESVFLFLEIKSPEWTYISIHQCIILLELKNISEYIGNAQLRSLYAQMFYLNERHRVWLNNLDLLCSQWAPIFPQGLRLLKAVILQPCVHKVHKTYAIEWDGALIWEEEENVTYYIYLVIYIPVRASKLDLSSYLVIVQ